MVLFGSTVARSVAIVVFPLEEGPLRARMWEGGGGGEWDGGGGGGGGGEGEGGAGIGGWGLVGWLGSGGGR